MTQKKSTPFWVNFLLVRNSLECVGVFQTMDLFFESMVKLSQCAVYYEPCCRNIAHGFTKGLDINMVLTWDGSSEYVAQIWCEIEQPSNG